MTTTNDSFMRLHEVLKVFPVKRSTWYKGVLEGRYPAQVKLGCRAAAWRRSDIERLVAKTIGAAEAK